MSTYRPASGNHLILLFFFLTGLTGLAYELVWIRLLILAFGSTQFAITTVLVVFMAGLALGSLIFGRIVDRTSKPLLVYAAIEVALGVYCVLSPAVFFAVKSVYLHLSGTGGGVHIATFESSQFLLSFAALIIPTTLMGGTLPCLVKYLASRSGRVGFHTALPYAINTLGAVSGCLLTGFFSMYLLGVKTTVYAAGAVDIIIGALVYFLYGRVPVEARKESQADSAHIPEKTSAARSIVIASFALSGFASLAYEVLWTRVFSLVLGSSVYAFTIMLATFLAGIGIGSIVFAPFIDRRKNPLVWFATLEGVIGMVSLLSIFFYRELPFVFYSLKEAFAARFWFFLLIQFVLCAAIMIIPTLSMGAIFPLVGRIITKDVKTVGKSIGDIYFFNTAGSIFGSFIGGFILIPFIGVQNGVIVIAALNMAICTALLWISGIKTSLKAATAGALTVFFLISAAALPPWEKTIMTLGLYVNPLKESKVSELKAGGASDNLLYYKEGINAIVTVRGEGKDNSTITYQANGKQEAMAVSGRPSKAWAVLGHVPMLLHPGDPDEALVVGLGSGITLGAMVHYPLKSYDVVELETAVVDAARFFKESNNHALDDSRVKLHITDGRSFLSASRKKYDVIVSGVSDPWISGVSNLFTYEYFEDLSDKLNDDGIVALWFQNYRITQKEFEIGLNTFAAVFPYASIWFHYTDTLDLVVIGSKKPHGFDMEALRGKLSMPEVKRGLARIDVHTPYDVLDLFLIGNADLRKYLGTTGLNTDEHPILEFTLPKHLYMDPALGVKMVEELLNSVNELTPPVKMPENEREAFYISLGKTYYRSNFRLNHSLRAFENAFFLNPRNKETIYYIESLKKELGV